MAKELAPSQVEAAVAANALAQSERRLRAYQEPSAGSTVAPGPSLLPGYDSF